MKFLHLQLLFISFVFVLISGCGSGSGDYNGDLNVTPSTLDNGNSTSNVTFTVTYTNSRVTDFQGTPVIINTTVDGLSLDNHTDYFSSSGVLAFTYNNIPANSSIRLQAQMGSIVRSASVVIAASNLSLAQTILNFPLASNIGTLRTTQINGGTPTYSASSSTADITASVLGSTLTVSIANQNNTGIAKTATVTVSDSSGKTATVTINY